MRIECARGYEGTNADKIETDNVSMRKALGNPAYYVWRDSDEKKAP